MIMELRSTCSKWVWYALISFGVVLCLNYVLLTDSYRHEVDQCTACKLVKSTLSDSVKNVKAKKRTNREPYTHASSDPATNFETRKRTNREPYTHTSSDPATNFEAKKRTNSEPYTHASSDPASNFEAKKRTNSEPYTHASSDPASNFETKKRTNSEPYTHASSDPATNFETKKRTNSDFVTRAPIDSMTNVEDKRRDSIELVSHKDTATITQTEGIFHSRRTNETCEKRLPKVILVGSMKSGTSAIMDFLNYHPQIAACRKPDEPRYFTKHYTKHSLEWYRNLMPCSFSDQLTMEKSPSYFYQNKTALRIKQMNNKTLILMAFKDPVQVAVSLYAMNKDHGYLKYKNKSFEDIVTTVTNNGSRVIDTKSNMISITTYVLHTRKWVDIFGLNQVYAIDGSSFDKHPLKELKLLESFLGIRPYFKWRHFVFSEKKKKYCFRPDEDLSIQCLPPGKGRPHPVVSDEVTTLLKNYFRPYNTQLSQLLNRTFVWQ